MDIVADDLSPETLEFISKKAPVLANHLWNMITKSYPMQYLADRLKSILGVDLNDD